jgi:hypothetical protein
MNRKLFLRLPVLLMISLVFQACSFPGQSSDEGLDAEFLAQTYVAQTAAASADDENAADSQSNMDDSVETTVPSPTLTETPSPTATLTATMTLTPTLSIPLVDVSVDTNCRTGPGEVYDYIGALLIGEQAEVVGQSADGQYWIIQNPDNSGECWLWGNYASVEGPVGGLPRYTPPPTPTPTFDWTGNWTSFTGEVGGPFDSNPLSITIDGNSLTGILSLPGGDTITLSGTLSSDFLSVSGTWTGPGPDGTFSWVSLGPNQFQGQANNGVDDFAWCGSRNGAGLPMPCFK